MKARKIIEITESEVLAGEELLDQVDITKGFASDLMSDVLALVDSQNRDVVLITGVTNAQIIRTAEILDIPMIIVARGKSVPKDVVKLAEDKGIILVKTDKIVFEISGILFQNGIRGANFKKPAKEER
ncbi:MAG: hypothetical protein WBH76_04250 [Dictyoglomaceae bacterium]|nr:hypothetical protein [Dictyoglomaceae bacterium]HOP94686.1 hypothetical protein [Dictyoglomaceae bacterium]HPP16100.1 hypothetical protein [Dictyoglomaceae bacterium]HPU43035.1 hypothetical protein [Dictyoglomaceae bacterium]